MSDIKEITISMIKNLPDNSTIDDILDAITLRKKIMEGLKNLDEATYISDEEFELKITKRIQEIKK